MLLHEVFHFTIKQLLFYWKSTCRVDNETNVSPAMAMRSAWKKCCLFLSASVGWSCKKQKRTRVHEGVKHEMHVEWDPKTRPGHQNQKGTLTLSLSWREKIRRENLISIFRLTLCWTEAFAIHGSASFALDQFATAGKRIDPQDQVLALWGRC